MAPPLVASIWLLLALFIAVAAAQQTEGCDCNAYAEVVAHQEKEIARLQAELRSLRGPVDGRRRLGNCWSSFYLGSDADVEAFRLAGCIVVDHLQIGTSSGLMSHITSLAGLSKLEYAWTVSVSNTDLQSLTGLENLHEVEGMLLITRNHQLRSLDGLQGLERAVPIRIEENDQLRSLDGLHSLEVGFGLEIRKNSQLRSLDGLQGTKRADSHVIIEDNDQLVSLDGLRGVTRVGGLLSIKRNPLLESLSGLESVTTCHTLLLRELPELRSIAALRKLTFVGRGGIHISACPKLHSLQGLGEVYSPELVVEDGDSASTLRWVHLRG